MEETIVDHDVYNEHGILLLSKGTKIVLSEHRYRQLSRMGILDEVIQPRERTQINDNMNHDIIPIEERKEQINKTIRETSSRLKGADYFVLQKATDILNSIIFENKNEDWYRFVSLIFSYVDWLYTHSLNVAIIGCVIASTLGYDDKQLFNIAMGSLFHDIGLTLLPKKTLSKFSGFTEVEDNIVKNHCEMGYSMINEVNLPQVSKEIILQHHERLDGSGYPNKLGEHQINPESMIAMVAEYFDTATTARVYKPADPIQATIDRMYLEDNLFPRHIVKVLINILLADMPENFNL
ncbi:MAG: HD domain-containing protein [Oscillospiraceae bacterium]|jgi:putative nucleotidyltransferase with HDIG domain|nr:HD domain-containing protein [Oscillospiraceae bacterium]